MNKLLIIGLAFVLYACKSSVSIHDSKDIKEITNSETVSITASQVKDIITVLASDKLLGRDTGSSGIDEAATYIETQFLNLGLKPYFKTYRNHFNVEEKDAFNVVAYLKGTDEKLKDEVIILGAHYDHIGFGKPVENDSIANGANDNAAGTSAVLSMANYFSKAKTNKRSLMFVLFSAEEKGLLGSKHLAKQLNDQNLNLYTMFNVEMIGVPVKNIDYKAFVSGHNISNMADKLNTYANDSKFIGFHEITETYQLFKRSDNYPFYLEFNVPCQSISTSDDYIYYHHVDDEVDKLDYNHMADIINIMIPAIEKMSQTSTKEIVLYEN